jgi:predicted transcriptional regulator of viral defense system
MAAKIKMAKDFKNSPISMPSLTLKQIQKFGKKNISRISSKHLGAYVNIHDKMLRVSSIGRTFLDMIRKPDLCGGIHNCLDVFQQHSPQYLKLIIDEITQHGNSIEKVRGGYILEEYCKIKHKILDNALEEWVTHAQRGGSRKLDPNNDYWPVFSEKWCLSINTEL